MCNHPGVVTREEHVTTMPASQIKTRTHAPPPSFEDYLQAHSRRWGTSASGQFGWPFVSPGF
jgi:hypothetical protein